VEASAIHAPAYLGRRLTAGPLLRLRSDDQLVALFRMGYDEAFAVIHDRYRQRLFAYTRQMLPGARSDAEDALQDVFLRAYSALRDDDRPVTLRAWLYRVAHNRCVDQLRRPVPAASEIFDVSRLPLHDPLVQTQLREDLRRLVCDVRRLPGQQRSALLMRELEGLSYTELADALGVTVPAVKSLLVRARMGLMEAGEARDAPCAEIRAELSLAYGRGVRVSGRSRRHLRDCTGCRGYKRALRGTSQGFGVLSGGGACPAIAKLLGLGGAGSGAAVGGGASGGSGAAVGGGALVGGTAIGGGGAAVAGGGTIVAKVAVAVCCAAVVGGGATEAGRRLHPQPAPLPKSAPAAVSSRAAQPTTAAPATAAVQPAASTAGIASGRPSGAPASEAPAPVVVGRTAQPTIELAGPSATVTGLIDAGTLHQPHAVPAPVPGPAPGVPGSPVAAAPAPAPTPAALPAGAPALSAAPDMAQVLPPAATSAPAAAPVTAGPAVTPAAPASTQAAPAASAPAQGPPATAVPPLSSPPAADPANTTAAPPPQPPPAVQQPAATTDAPAPAIPARSAPEP
jgi:RNA polymerase sigma factor (sigma-70 family)